MNGALIIDKPAGMTSHDVVNAVRRLSGERRIGHIGTLDPFATGVLVLLMGKATRLARFFEKSHKTYRAEMRVGFATDTYDSTGNSLGPDLGAEFEPAKIEPLFHEFLGTSLQQPPAFSAKKIGGVPAYKKARRGQAVDLKPVEVSISNMDLLDIRDQLVIFSVTVSSGTYIRSLANDVGMRLGLGGHLTGLRRLAVGEFGIEQAVALARLKEQISGGAAWNEFLIPIERLLTDLPSQGLSEMELAAILHGRSIVAVAESSWLRLLAPDGTLAAMAKLEAPGSYHPEVVLRDVVELQDPAPPEHSNSPAISIRGGQVGDD